MDAGKLPPPSSPKASRAGHVDVADEDDLLALGDGMSDEEAADEENQDPNEVQCSAVGRCCP